ncbi:MAG: HipA domain-containing protein, partial [Gammaproteobacteria bacterium]
SATLPGEFDKFPAVIEQRQVGVVLGQQATTHVIKPAKPGLRESVMNEAYCMALAEACGLPVAATRVVHGQVSVLAVERIDRAGRDWSHACHLEDFCQALGCPPGTRYEREGGPRLADIAALVRRVSAAPALDLRALIRWSVFSYLVGFGAAHGKQLVLVHTPSGPRLGAFFGLYSTHVYPEMSYRMGFSIGAEDRPDWLGATRWREFAESIGVKPRYVVRQLAEMAGRLPATAAAVAEAFQRENGFAEITRGIRALIEQRCRQALVSIEAEAVVAGPAARRHGA